jgi:hypothetical protein
MRLISKIWIVCTLSFCCNAQAITKTIDGIATFESFDGVDANNINQLNDTTFAKGLLTTTATGSISIVFRGILNQTFILDWGHGAPELVTLLGATAVTKTHNYSGVAGTKTIALRQGAAVIDYVDANSCFLQSMNFSAMSGLLIVGVHYNSALGSISTLSNLSQLTQIFVLGNTALTDLSPATGKPLLTLLWAQTASLVYTTLVWPKLNNANIKLSSAQLSSGEVDQVLIDFASAGGTGITNSAIDLAGTNAARTSASNAALSILQANGCTVVVNE